MSELIAQSRNRDIYGLEGLKVMKVFRDGSGSGDLPLDQLRARLTRKEEDREAIRVKLSRLGTSAALVVPEVRVALCQKPNGKPYYVEYQQWFKGARPLSEVGFGVLNLPPNSLDDLRNILSTSLSFFQERGVFVDLGGSNLARPTSFRRRLLQRSAAMFTSENIVVDQQDWVRLVDASIFEPLPTKSLLNLVSEVVQVASLRGSMLLIERILERRSRGSETFIPQKI